MKTIAYLWINFWLTLLRVLPFPCKTALVRIGTPGRDSPVLLTGNYRLTVARVRHALRGVDAWLLVANSRGVNVWCAATGGLLSNHDVISVVKTSGVEGLVDHRELILPQLAATGIEERVVQERTGWRVQWGPVEAVAVPDYLAAGRQKSPAMQSVNFPWLRRLELAVAWAFPISLLVLPLIPLWPESVWPLTALVWGMSLAMFLSFPLYEQRLRSPARPVGWVFFNFGPRGVLLIFWALFLTALMFYSGMAGEFSWPWPWAWLGR